MSPPTYDEVDQVLAQAAARAAGTDDNLAAAVLEARALRKRYRKKPMVIRIPFWGAILSLKWGLLWSTHIEFSPNYPPGEKFDKKDKWRLRGGLRVTRGIQSDGLPDEDTFSIAQIDASGEPEKNYIWITDLVRSIQSLWNFVCTLLGLERVELLDLWGSLLFKAGKGNDDIYLDLVTHPAQVARKLRDMSGILMDGDESWSTLTKRMDTRTQQVEAIRAARTE